MKVKKLLAGIMSATMVLSTMSFNAFAADEVAQIGSEKYATLEEAMTGATTGDTIKLLEDASLGKTDFNNSIDLNGKTLTLKAGSNYIKNDITISSGNINIDGSAITTADTIINLYSANGNVNATFENVNINANGFSASCGLLGAYDESKLTYNGGTITVGDNNAIGVDAIFNGGLGNCKGKFEIKNVIVNVAEGSSIEKVMYCSPEATIDNLIFTGTVEKDTFSNVSGTVENSKFNYGSADMRSIVNDASHKTDLEFENVEFNDVPNCTKGVFCLTNAGSGIVADSETTIATTQPTFEAKIGGTSYAKLAGAFAAAVNDDEITVLGNIDVTTDDFTKLSGKDVTIKGENETAGFVFPTGDYTFSPNMNNANITFEELTMTWGNYIYRGFQNSGNLEYKNCVINGQAFLYGVSEKFTSCTFNQTSADAYNVWTYGAGIATFDNCTFNSNGKSVLIYRENDTNEKEVDIKSSIFNAENPVAGKAAVEIDSSLAPVVVNINASEANGFSNGSISGNSLWNVKKGSTATNKGTTLIVDGTEINLSTVNIAFIKNSEDEQSHVYDIYVTSLDSINKLNSVDLTFDLNNDGMDYVIKGEDNVDVTSYEENRYMFNYNDGANRKDGTSIKIGTVTVTGFGEYEFKVAEADTNIVNATTIINNIVTSFDTTGAENVGVLKIEDATTGAQEIKEATRKLAINITFPNAVESNVAAYQDMKVTIKGGKATDETIKLGEMTDGGYKIERELVKDTPYTVTVSGAGYRTASYTVTLNADKTLNFWNNVMTTAKAVEEGKASSAKTTTFLAGEIVKDGKINIYDLSAVVSYFGTINNVSEASVYAQYDLNRDGKVDSKDVAYVLASFNN